MIATENGLKVTEAAKKAAMMPGSGSAVEHQNTQMLD
jgi:hypothetical protein